MVSIIKKTLEENYIFFIQELTRINEEISKLPKGNISAKKIGKSTYYYHQWREGRKIRSISLGKNLPVELIEGIKKRNLLEKQRKEILDEINIITRAIDTQRVTVEEILRIFSQNGVNVIPVGSYCLPILKDSLKLNLPTIKTQDIDFLVALPYKGEESDIESLLKPLGFLPGFNSDGSTYFSNGTFKIEFLTPEKGREKNNVIYIEPLKIKAVPLRFVQMLTDELIQIKRENYSYSVPSPWVFACHKILVSRKRRAKDKKEKDILQANAILREMFKNPGMAKKTTAYISSLPSKWKKEIKAHIATALDIKIDA